MNFIKKNLLWIVAGFLVYKNWDKIGPMLGMGKKEDEQVKAYDVIDDSETLA